MYYESENEIREIKSELLESLLEKEQRKIIKKKVRLYQVFRYNYTGAHFFFGAPPYDETEFHLWVLEERLPGCPTNYQGRLTCKPQIYTRGAKCIYLDHKYSNQSSLYADDIKYLRGKKAEQLQKIVDQARAEHLQITKKKWKETYH